MTTVSDETAVPEPDEVVGWADVSPGFGSAMPYGSCNALLGNGRVCGYPRTEGGTCGSGHRRD